MTSSLQKELQQAKPFPSLEVEAYLSVARTAALLGREVAEVLKPYGLTPTQYNVLRILRGAGSDGLCRYEVDDRLVTPVPDVTRLLDRLEAAGLVSRRRADSDRRMVKARITSEGMSLLATLEEALLEVNRRQMGHMGEESLQSLINLLAEAREKV